MYQIILSSDFQRQLKRLINQNPRLRNRIGRIFKLIIQDMNHPSLKLHKLKGENNWSISLTYSLRIIVHIEGNQIFCLRIGSHDQVY